MIVYIFYTRNTPADRDIDRLKTCLEEHRVNMELIDADSRRGAGLLTLYDILQRPAVVVARDDGGVVAQWQGELPRLEDVAGQYSVHG